MDGVSELAVLFKERDNKYYLGPQIGKVISPLPEIKIALGEKIILVKEHLIIASHILKGYEREFSVEGQLKFSDSYAGMTEEAYVSQHGFHQHEIESLKVNTDYESTGKIRWTDSLEEGDEVILIPTTNEQQYYVIDKVVRP